MHIGIQVLRDSNPGPKNSEYATIWGKLRLCGFPKQAVCQLADVMAE